MDKHDLINNVARHTGITREATALILETLIAEIKSAVERGEKVTLSHFGTFLLGTYVSRPVRDFRTNEHHIMPEYKAPKFITSRTWKETLLKKRKTK